MKLQSALYIIPLVQAGAHKRPAYAPYNETSTVWLCGDSTMAPGGGHNGTEGWGQYLHYSLDSSKVRVNNSAYAGRSARTFTREGRFQAIADQVAPGDWVLIEFGINDAGNPYNDTANRKDCPGIGGGTCSVASGNGTEIVQTYGTYVRNASRIFLSLGARVIISPPTPLNPYQDGNYSWAPTIYHYYAWYVVQELGGPDAGVYFVDHSSYAAQAEYLLGADYINPLYPMDNTHTAPVLAAIFAQAWVFGLKCGTSPLQNYVVNATSRIEGPTFGTCLPVNSTLPI